MGKQHTSGHQHMGWGERLGHPPSEFGRAVIDCLNRHRHTYLISADSGGRITACNQAMARLLGLTSDEIRDQSIWDRLTVSDAARLKQRLQQVPFPDDALLLNFVPPDHSPATLDCSLRLMSGGHFAMVGVPAQSSAGDSELAWLRLNNGFATLSRQNARKSKQLAVNNSELLRTAGELQRANQALTEARTAALRAAQAKSDFLSHMSHEIRTPMNGVIAMLQLLLTTALSAEQQRYAEVAQTSGRALLALIDDILDLSKIEAGKIAIESLDFDPRRTVEDVVAVLRVQANAKGIAFHCRVAPELPTLLRGDPNRLRQVLNNLAANAIKFTARGEVTLLVQLASREGAQATVRFAVTDTGIGIRPDQAAALFSPFVQADVSTTRKYGGTGLGLAISKQLVGLMGGKIGLESREGEGSTFWFTARFETPPVATTPASSARIAGACISVPTPAGGLISSPPSDPRSSRQARILVAEDDPTNQFVALALLAKLGYQADTVADGAQAVEAVLHGAYDLVLMDCQMPAMDGYEATHLIRQSANSRVPIVAVTANAMSDDRDRCLRQGMDDFLSKPVDLVRLAEVLARWIPGSDPGIAAPPAEPVGSAASVAAFDAEALLERLMGDRPLAGVILKAFLEECPSQLDRLRRTFDEADAPAAGLRAHALKGAAGAVSAGSLHAVAREMERAAGTGQLARFGELLPRAAEEFERFKNVLELAGWP